MTKSWFFYFLRKSIAQRKSRFIIASSAVLLTVAVVTALITLSSGVREKIGGELKRYGANMIVTEKRGGLIPDETLHAIKSISQYISEVMPQIYATATVDGAVIELIGMEPETMKGLRIQGRLPRTGGEIMVGINIAAMLNLKQGQGLVFDEDVKRFEITGVFEKGSDEDSAIVMPMGAARRVFNMEGVSAILLNVDTRHLKAVKNSITKNHPSLEVKTLRQVAIAEEIVLGKIQLLMLLVTGVVLFSSIIALGSTMGANIIERMEEIGLMKALGATPADIKNFFLSEAALAGIGGALTGYLVGIIAAELISKTAFGSFIPVHFLFIFLSVFLGICIAVISTFFPVRDAMKVVPAQILRGE